MCAAGVLAPKRTRYSRIWRQLGFRARARRPSRVSWSPRLGNDEGFAARPSQTRTARTRAMARGKSTRRGVGHVACACALALARACAPTRARAQAPSPKTNSPQAAPGLVEADRGVVETAPPAIISLPVVLAPVPDLDRDDEAGVAARARLREAHAPRESPVAEDRGAPGVSGPRRRFSDDSVEKTSNCYLKECAHAIYGQPTIGAGSPMPYPKVVRGVSAPWCLLNQPPTCVCFGPFTYLRPWGYYCVVVVPPKNTPSPPPPIESPSPPPIESPSPPPIETPSPPPSPPQAQCGDPPVGFTCDASPGGVDPCGFCVFVNGVRSCCCDAECETVFGDCCADKSSCCDERRTLQVGKRRERASAARIEARARRG